MFQRIVSRLSLSPSAMSDLVFYARRLKQEKITRTFSALAAVLIVGLQFATIAAPPAPSNAASSNDIIYGGFVSKNDLLNRFDASDELKTLYDYFGINRTDIQNTRETTINSKDHSLISIGRNQHGTSDGKVVLGSHTYWTRGLYVWDTGANVQRGSSYKVLEGTRSRDGGYFSVIFHCGNIVFKTLPPKPVPPPPPKPPATPIATPPPKATLACVKLNGDVSTGEVPLTVNFTGEGTASNQTITEYQFNFGDGKTTNQPEPAVSHQYNTAGKWTATLKVKGSKGTLSDATPACSFTVTTTTPPAVFTKAKSALNVTQTVDATTKPALPGDTIRYSLTTKNTGGTTEDYAVIEHIEDVLEYADVVDAGGADLAGGVLSWAATKLEPDKSLVKNFTVKVKDPIPTTPVGLSDKFSYDLRMDNIYGTGVQIAITPPLAKQVEGASTTLPDTGAASTTFLILLVVAVCLFFYFRNRQLMTEIKLLRGEYQGGL